MNKGWNELPDTILGKSYFMFCNGRNFKKFVAYCKNNEHKTISGIDIWMMFEGELRDNLGNRPRCDWRSFEYSIDDIINNFEYVTYGLAAGANVRLIAPLPKSLQKGETK